MAFKSLFMKSAAACAVAALLVPVAAAQLAGGPRGDRGLILHDNTGFTGEAVRIDSAVSSMSDARFNDKASSIQVLGGSWELCSDGNFRGRCEVVTGDVGDLRAIGLGNNISSVRPAGRRGGRGDGAGGPRGDRPGTGYDRGAPIVLYSQENFRGEARSFDGNVQNLSRAGFNDRAESVRVNRGVWLLCDDANFGGRCEYVDRDVSDLRRIGLRGNISSISLSPYDQGPGEYDITLFQHDNFRGAFLGFDEEVRDLSQYNYNDTASSIRVTSGRWLVCSDRDFRGDCEIIRGSVRDLDEFFLNDKITSLRPARRGDRPSAGGGYGPRGDNGYGNDYPRPRGGGYGPRGGYDGGYEGQDTVFFPRPLDRRGSEIRNGDGRATRFCRDNGFSGAAYKSRGRYLKDVLCTK